MMMIMIPDEKSAIPPLRLATCGGNTVSIESDFRITRLFVIIALPDIKNTTPPVVSPSLIIHLPLSA